MLLVGPGDDIESRFGHLDLRVIYCSKSGAWSEKHGCNLESITVGFHANSKDWGESEMWRTLSDDYIVQLHAFRMENRIAAYITKEDRTIDGYSLNLSPEEKKLFIQLLFEKYLFYRGSWNSATDNCVTNLSQIFQVVFNVQRPWDDAYTFPKTFVEHLGRMGRLRNGYSVTTAVSGTDE